MVSMLTELVTVGVQYSSGQRSPQHPQQCAHSTIQSLEQKLWPVAGTEKVCTPRRELVRRRAQQSSIDIPVTSDSLCALCCKTWRNPETAAHQQAPCLLPCNTCMYDNHSQLTLPHLLRGGIHARLASLCSHPSQQKTKACRLVPPSITTENQQHQLLMLSCNSIDRAAGIIKAQERMDPQIEHNRKERNTQHQPCCRPKQISYKACSKAQTLPCLDQQTWIGCCWFTLHSAPAQSVVSSNTVTQFATSVRLGHIKGHVLSRPYAPTADSTGNSCEYRMPQLLPVPSAVNVSCSCSCSCEHQVPQHVHSVSTRNT